MNGRAMRKTFSFARTIAISALLAVSACGPRQPSLDDAPLAGAAIGGDFNLIDKSGKPVRWSDFAGKWRMVYFGYTSCPDACPLDMGKTMQGFKKYADAHADLAEKVQPLFISVDPERDTPQRVGEFAAAFSPRLMGLTGKPEEIAKAAKAFAVYYGRGKDLPGGGYIMDHSRVVYLFDQQGKPVIMLPADKGADAVAEELAKWVR